MDKRKHAYLATIGLALAFLVYGCAGYGKFVIQSSPGERVSIEELQKNWNDYTIYYSGLSETRPRGIMFDPKHDNRRLVGDQWIKVEDQQMLSKLVSWMQFPKRGYPELYRILGPDDEFYGYLYHNGHRRAVAKVVDDRTMYVYDLTPSYHGGPGP
ncbi:hypothetical protein ES703_56776 [subsurface metagenome]